MSRHIRWGCILPFAFLIVIAASSPIWLPVADPYLGPNMIEDMFICPESVTPEICAALTVIDERDPAEAEAMVVAVLAPAVPAPSNEDDQDSIRGDIDPNTVSELTETSVRVGQFTKIDVLHGASGRATIWEIVADAEILRVLRFDNDFTATNGPDLRVYLSGHGDPRTPDELNYANLAVEIGMLKGNIGSQNYVLDNSLDVTRYSSVVIYSPSLEVVFSTAPLQQPIR